MNNLGGIRLAIELATKQRDACQKKLAILERSVSAAEAQMAQLGSYASDKDAGWIQAKPGAFSGELIRHHYQFVGRLQQAIGMQSEVLAHSIAQVASARKSLADAEARLEGLNRILSRRVSAIAILAGRRDQKQTDDFAAQRYARMRAEFEQGDAR